MTNSVHVEKEIELTFLGAFGYTRAVLTVDVYGEVVRPDSEDNPHDLVLENMAIQDAKTGMDLIPILPSDIIAAIEESVLEDN